MFKSLISTLKETRKKVVVRSLAVVSGIGMTVGLPSAALAQATDLGGIADTLNDQLDNIGTLIVAGALIVGIVLIIAGLLKLKQASDTQGQQVKWADGIWRIVVGVGLVSILYFTGVGAATFGLETDADLGGSTLSIGGSN